MEGIALLRRLWRGTQQRCLAHNYVSRRSMSSRLFVGGLSFTTDEEGLRTAFSKHGEVVEARIVTDRESGRSRGFGFVTFLSETDAQAAKDKMNHQFLNGRVIRVDIATPRPPPPRLSTPLPEPSDEQPASQDWGSISSPMAAVPQNAGLSQTELPSLSSLASSAQNTGTTTPLASSVAATTEAPAANADLPASSAPISDATTTTTVTTTATPATPTTAPPAEAPKPFFLDLSDLPAPDPNFVPRRRPPRIRASMMDYEFGYFSETSRFPFNTNFDTGFLRVKGPEWEFDFTDIKEALAKKKAEEDAAKKAKEEAEAATKQAEEAEAAAKQGEEAVLKQAEETGGALSKQASEAMVVEPLKQSEKTTDVSSKEAQETQDASAKKAQEVKEEVLGADSQVGSVASLGSSASGPAQASSECIPQSTLQAEDPHMDAAELKQVKL